MHFELLYKFIIVSFHWSRIFTFEYLIVPSWTPSHTFYISKIGQSLVNRGHNVTIAITTSFGTNFFEKNHPEFKILQFNDSSLGIKTNEFLPPDLQVKTINRLRKTVEYDFELHNEACLMMWSLTEAMLRDTTFMQTVTKLSFDLAIVDDFAYGRGTLLLPQILRIPFVTCSSRFYPWRLRIPALPSAFPSILTPLTPEMTFAERLYNTLFFLKTEPTEKCNQNVTLLRKYTNYTDWMTLYRESSLFIIARDPFLDYPFLTFPNIIMTGGLTSTSTQGLDNKFKSLADSANNSLVLISFGSMYTTLPTDSMIEFTRVAAAMPQLTFVMRHKLHTYDRSIGIPNNLKIFESFPQSGLLAHKNTVLFITHCGNNGQNEAIINAVPMISVPIFADQHYNAARAQYKQIAITMNLVLFKAVDMVKNINRIIGPNSTYRDNVLKLSRMIKQKTLHSKELAGYWIEHVTEFGGDHLRPQAFKMAWYKYYMIDIFAAVFLLVFLVLVGAFIVLKYMVSRCFGRNTSNRSVSRHNKNE